MEDESSSALAPDGARLPTDRRTLLCVALGGAIAAAAVRELSAAPTWRALDFDIRLAGLAVVSVLVGVLIGVRDLIGDRWFAFGVFGVLAGFASVGMYALVGLLGMPPSAGVRFLFGAPVVAAVGIGGAAALVRRVRR